MSDTRWGMGKVYNYTDGLGKFDSQLEKAIGIAEKRGNGFQDDEGWFLILEFLQNYITEVKSKVQPIH